MVNHGFSSSTTKSKAVVIRHTSSSGAGSSDGKSRRLMALLWATSSASLIPAPTVERQSTRTPPAKRLGIVSRRRQELGYTARQSLERKERVESSPRQHDQGFIVLDRVGYGER